MESIKKRRTGAGGEKRLGEKSALEMREGRDLEDSWERQHTSECQEKAW